MFRNRTEAGKALAEVLSRMIADDPTLADPVVLALPRGGLPVAFEIARVLKAPLDLVLVRKIGVPYQPELAVGAVVDGDDPQIVINQDVLRLSGMTEVDLEAVQKRALEEIERRRALYLKDRKRVPVENRTVIVVDDGIATGATTNGGDLLDLCPRPDHGPASPERSGASGAAGRLECGARKHPLPLRHCRRQSALETGARLRRRPQGLY